MICLIRYINIYNSVCTCSILTYVEQFFESDFTLRDPISHDYHCSLLDGTLAAEDSITYGVNHTSVLSKISDFHVTDQLPQDIMHVIFEGVLNLETRLILSSFVNKSGYFTLDFLNQRMTNFSYGRAEKQAKPPRSFTTANLTGSKLPLSGISIYGYECNNLYLFFSLTNVEFFNSFTSYNWRQNSN